MRSYAALVKHQQHWYFPLEDLFVCHGCRDLQYPENRVGCSAQVHFFKGSYAIHNMQEPQTQYFLASDLSSVGEHETATP